MTEKRGYTHWFRPALTGLLLHWFILFTAWAVWRSSAGQPLGGFFSAWYEHLSGAGDIPHYLRIAQEGYHAAGEYANEIVFFPLFPLLIRAAHLLVPDWLTAGLLVSNLCLCGASAVFFRLLEEEYGTTRAWEGLLLLTLYPVSFFMAGAYTESLFLLLCALCLLFLRHDRWFAAGVTGLLAALSRSQGIVLLVPAVYEFCIALKEGRVRLVSAFSLPLIPCGTLLYLGMNKLIAGDWTAFLRYQADAPWYNISRWIAENIATHVRMAGATDFLAVIIYIPQIVLYFGSIVLLLYGLRRGVRTSYIAMGGAYLFVTYLHGWMISGPRYILGGLPLFITAAGALNERGRRFLTAFFGLMAAAFAVWALQGQSIM